MLEVAVSKPLNITGLRFGRLLVLERQSNDRHGKTRWLCACDCGKTSIIVGGDLRSGKTNSCGCRAGWRHGFSGTKIYQCYWNMRCRCLDPKNKEYKNYGGRGITICDRWLNDAANFCNDILAELGERPLGMSLDRIDNDGNYEPGNVRWATPEQQGLNRRVVSKHPTKYARRL
jgi:hypothetical protein